MRDGEGRLAAGAGNGAAGQMTVKPILSQLECSFDGLARLFDGEPIAVNN
jgi:hypothetical protein